ncbi:MAG: NUDIX domain-containing protein [Chloroflexota bacterium]
MTQSPKVGVGALIIQNNQLLLAQRKGSHAEGTYGSVGGHVEFGESPEEALIREGYEELGITLGKISFLACTNMIMYDQHYIDLGFQASIIAGTPEIQPAEVDKFIRIGWYDLDQLPSPLFGPIETYIEAWRTGNRYFDLRDTAA